MQDKDKNIIMSFGGSTPKSSTSSSTPDVTIKTVQDMITNATSNLVNNAVFNMLESDIEDLEQQINNNTSTISFINNKVTNMGYGVTFQIADTQYQTQVNTPYTNNIQLVTAKELELHQEEDKLYLTNLANQIVNAQFTDIQKEQLANDILTQVGASAVTTQQMSEALNIITLSITTPQSIILNQNNCNLLFSKYQDGRMEITGTVWTDGTQVLFPDGYSFIDINSIGCGCIYADLDDQSNNVMHVGKIQVSLTDFLWKASSFGAAEVLGVPVSDDGKYRIIITGRWK